MNKYIKMISAMSAAVVMAFSLFSFGASAYTVSETKVAKFEWNTTYAKITNLSYTNRYMESHINVYRDNTGEYVTNLNKNATGTYNTYANRTTGNYGASSYNFEMWGTIYNSSSSMSGVKWSSGYKYVN